MHSSIGHIGSLTIHSYGLCLAIGFILGILWSMYEADKKGFDKTIILDLSAYVLIATILGSRILYVLLKFNDYKTNLSDIIKINEGGLSFHGGVIAGVTTVIIFCIKRKISILKLGDILIKALALGTVFGRLGCLMRGCCYGIPSNLPWAFAITSLEDNIRRHPTQIYEMFLSLLMFGILILVDRKAIWSQNNRTKSQEPRAKSQEPRARFKNSSHSNKDGKIIAYYLMLFSIVRFTVEIFRSGVSSDVYWIGLTLAQLASFGIFIITIIIMLLLAQNKISIKKNDSICLIIIPYLLSTIY